MAYIGMRKPVIAPILSHTDGSAISYGAGMVVGPAVSANLTFDTGDNPDYGDDVIIDNDNGINGYSITLETNDISKEARAAMLGWKPVTSGSPSAVTHYAVTDEAPPDVGLGYVRVKMYQGVRKYEGFWYHKLSFVSGGENASTKQKQITWNHPTMNGTGKGVYIDSTGTARYFDWMEFATESAAETWVTGHYPTAQAGT